MLQNVTGHHPDRSWFPKRLGHCPQRHRPPRPSCKESPYPLGRHKVTKKQQHLGNLVSSSRGTPTAGNSGAVPGLCACYTESYDVFWGGVLILVPGKGWA